MTYVLFKKKKNPLHVYHLSERERGRSITSTTFKFKVLKTSKIQNYKTYHKENKTGMFLKNKMHDLYQINSIINNQWCVLANKPIYVLKNFLRIYYTVLSISLMGGFCLSVT